MAIAKATGKLSGKESRPSDSQEEQLRAGVFAANYT